MKGAKSDNGQGAVTGTWVIADKVEKNLEIPTAEAIKAAEGLFGRDSAERMQRQREERLQSPRKHQVG